MLTEPDEQAGSQAAGDNTPSCAAIDGARRHARLPVHAGSAQLTVDGELIHGAAEFVLPADSGLIVAVQSSAKLTNDMAADLQVTGCHKAAYSRSRRQCVTRVVRERIRILAGASSHP